MTLSQLIVVFWIQFAGAAALLLYAARVALDRLVQPADRIRLIQLSLFAVISVPILMVAAPWPTWRLNWISRHEQSHSTQVSSSVESRMNTLPSTLAAEKAIPKEVVDPQQVAEFPSARPDSVPTSRTDSNPTSGESDRRNRISFWDAAAVAIVVAHSVSFLYLVLEWGIGYVLLRKLRRAASKSSVSLDRDWKSVAQGRGQHVRLLVSRSIDTPLMFGWFRPVVLLPNDLVEQESSSLTFCLAHEWSHIERHDMLAWNGVRMGQVFLWFVPAYWALRTELRLCQDMLADNSASRARADAMEYSELLVSFAKKRMRVPVAAALTFLHHPNQLTKRIKMLLLKSVSVRAHCSWKFSVASGIAALLSAALFSAVRLDATRAEENREGPQPTQPTASASGPRKYKCRVVEKETGKGIPGARIVVRRSNSQEHRIIEESQHTADVDGTYEFEIPEAQAADRYLYIELDVEHDSFAPKKGHGYSLAMIVQNEKLGERPFFEKTELFPAEPVTGTIVSPEGNPVAGVKVQSFSMASPRDFDTASFNETVSDVDGHFRLNFHKGSDGIMWVLPKDFAISERFLAKQRGDLGAIKLTAGVRVSGLVVGTDEKPLAGVAVNINFVGDRDAGGLPVATSVRRGVLSDAAGRFSFDPLAPGDYSVIPGEHLTDPLTRDRNVYEVPAVFVAKKLTIKNRINPAPLEIQAVPHVLFNAQIMDSEGKKTSGHEFFLFGELDGGFWQAQGRPNKEGTVALKVPHGLQKTRVQLMTNEHGALRYRGGKDQPLKTGVRIIDFGTLNEDVEGFEIVRYKAPIVLVSAVDEEQQPVKDFRVSATYPWGKQEYILAGETRSDMSFEHQNDGRYRTSQMLPDEDVTFTVSASGYQAVSEKVKLREGESKDLVVTLKKSEAAPPADGKK